MAISCGLNRHPLNLKTRSQLLISGTLFQQDNIFGTKTALFLVTVLYIKINSK